MATKAQKVRLGIFFLAGVAAIVVLVIVFAGQTYFADTDTYYIAYEDGSVRGLDIGSPVEYHGVRVGTVRDIRIDWENPSRIVVTVGVRKGTQIREDARADMAYMGITGLKAVEILGGTADADLLSPGDYIRAGSSSITEEVTGRVEVLAGKLENVLNNLAALTQPENQDKLLFLMDRAGEAFSRMDSVLVANQGDIRETVANMRLASTRFDTTSVLMLEAAHQLNTFVAGDTLGEILAATRSVVRELNQADLVELVTEIGELARRSNRLLLQLDRDIERGSGDFLGIIDKLNATLANLHSASEMINADPSVMIRGVERENSPDRRLEGK